MLQDDDISKYFARALGHADQQPNIDLANRLANNGSKDDVIILLVFFTSGTFAQQSDAIKVLLELAKLNPSLVAPHLQILIDNLPNANNRMIWGILQVINALVDARPEIIMKNLELILSSVDRSSVIAKDNLMAILSNLNGNKRFTKILTPVILQRLSHALPNQFLTYAELVASTIGEENRPALKEIILERQKSISSSAKLKRLEKLLKQL